MKKPSVSAARGLATLAGVVGSGTSDDILGFDYELASADERKRWDDVEAAAEWIRREVNAQGGSRG